MRDDHLEETRNAGIGGRCRYAASDTLGRESGSCGDAPPPPPARAQEAQR